MLTKCCCYFRLPNAGVFIGMLGLLACFNSFILAYKDTQSVEYFRLIIKEQMHWSNMEVDSFVEIGQNLYLVYILIHLSSSILLICGSFQSRHLLLLPWLGSSTISIPIYISYQFWNVGHLFAQNINERYFILILVNIIILLKFYFIYVICSLYKQIKKINKLSFRESECITHL